jgi:hypothetical protein
MRWFQPDLRPLPSGFSGHGKIRDLSVRDLGEVAVVHYWIAPGNGGAIANAAPSSGPSRARTLIGSSVGIMFRN